MKFSSEEAPLKIRPMIGSDKWPDEMAAAPTKFPRTESPNKGAIAPTVGSVARLNPFLKQTMASNEVCENFTIMGKAHTRVFFG